MKSLNPTIQKLAGTHAERLAIHADTLQPHCFFAETDSGDNYEWVENGWFKTGANRMNLSVQVVWDPNTLSYVIATGGSTPGQNVAVTNFPATQAVSIASPVAVTGPLTNTELRASNVAVSLGDSANLDAFSRLRVSQPQALFSVQQQYELSPFLMEGGATGTGTAPVHNANTRMADLVVGAGTGVSFTQSYEYIPYQAGKSQLAFATGLLGTATAGCIKDIGLFDSANGLFLRQNGVSGLQVVRRTSTSGSVVNNTVNQASWNLNTLASLDVTKVFILVIDAQFLAMGRVRIGFDIDGCIVYVHEFLNANVLAVPYMQTLTLPVAMVMSTTSAAGACSFKCSSVSSEGGAESPNAYTFSTLEQTVNAASGARTHIASIRPSLTFNGFTTRTRIELKEIAILVTGSFPVRWELCIGSTFSAGPTFGAVDANSSAAQSTAVGTLTAAGTVIASGYVAGASKAESPIDRAIASKYPISLDRAGAVRANGTLTLIVTGIGGASATRAAINYSEVR